MYLVKGSLKRLKEIRQTIERTKKLIELLGWILFKNMQRVLGGRNSKKTMLKREWKYENNHRDIFKNNIIC